MKKIRFWFGCGYTDVREEIFEYPNDVTDEEIQSDYDDWMG